MYLWNVKSVFVCMYSTCQLIFSRKSDCLGCAVLLFLVCLFDLACFFLSSLIYKHACILQLVTSNDIIILNRCVW